MATCYACHTEIIGPSEWLADDGGDSPKYVDAYEMHPACANQPWPLYPVSADEAAEILARVTSRSACLRQMPSKGVA